MNHVPIPPVPDVRSSIGAVRPRPRDVRAALAFILPQAEKPVYQGQAFTGGESRFFFEADTHTVPIADLRPQAHGFTLDRAGFALRTAPTSVADLYDDAAVTGAYFDETREFLKRELGAKEVAIFDVARRADTQAGAANQDGARGIASRIHVDYTANSGPQRAADVLGEAAVRDWMAAGAHIVQVNLWRPIRGPVRRSPLALADASSVALHDLIPTDLVYPDRVGENYHLVHNAAQRWYYAPEMTRDEVLLIKGWDSRGDAVARFTPHTAFALPDQDPAAPPRESIEVRAFAAIA